MARPRYYYARLAVLASVLIVVVAYALHDVASRRARKAWDHTLAVAVIVIRNGAVDDTAIAGLRERAPVLEAQLEKQLHRYRTGAPKPFAFTVVGPIDGVPPSPTAASDGWLDLASHSWNLHLWTRDVDARVKLATNAYDSRIYVTAEPPKSMTAMIEGTSEQGGRVGVVTVDLDASTVDFAWSVIAHELFHTLDATDEYDDKGNTKIPEGLAEPDLSPRLPQPLVEIMTRSRPLSASEERSLDTLDELGVGPVTARQIGWLR